MIKFGLKLVGCIIGLFIAAWLLLGVAPMLISAPNTGVVLLGVITVPVAFMIAYATVRAFLRAVLSDLTPTNKENQ